VIWRERQRGAGRSVVMTNGHFDLLHVGHIRYLQGARRLGDALVVGLNSDASTRARKPGRPLVPQEDRAELLAALESVDVVVIFDDLDAKALAAALRPEVYVKGEIGLNQEVPAARSRGRRRLWRERGLPPLRSRSLDNSSDHRIRALADG